MATNGRSCCAWLALLLAACSGGPFPQTAQPNAPLELTLASADGRTLRLSALRDRPALLFLFATYDPTSQLALTRLMAATEREERVTLLGIAVQPDAKEFLEPFKEIVDVPFPLYYDVDGALLQGRTELGKLPGVPAFVALDRRGHPRRTLVGVPSRDELEDLIESAL